MDGGDGRYDARARPPFAVAVDLVVLAVHDQLEVLTITRGIEPFEGVTALPGGFVGPAESVEEAAWRELAEETGLGPAELPEVHLEQLATYGAVDRDPRMRVVTVAHLALSPTRPEPTGGTDAAASAWRPVEGVLSEGLAFDHDRILADGVERARAKLEYTTLAARLAGPDFTMGELQAVFEAVWGVELERANFRRKVLSVPGFVESTGSRRIGRGGGAPATVFRAGPATTMLPPLIRP